ncbi:MAG TPA: hypothetical protein DEP66_00975, partial [Acidimicrobiaceae bacterium]|nr:hypothetical protein [Acidimicrobiaceae bacterium]
MSDDDMADDDMSLPGEGVDVTMARATWSTGYFQAEVYASLMRELGYNVSEPAEAELANDVAYVSMAQGDITFWVNSWYPGHRKFLKSELTDGSLVEDSVTAIGEELVAGGLQGLLISKDFADEYGITTLEDLNSNADAIAALDAVDGDPGNGVGNIYGCPESWTCDDIIQSQLAFAGLDNLKQILAGYDAMFAAALDDVNAGRPAVIYTWTPSAYVTQLLPGKNVYWIGYESILDDSNPLGLEGGAELSQVPGTGAIPEASCPAAADNADGLCPIGWIAADILVTANNDFLDDNP